MEGGSSGRHAQRILGPHERSHLAFEISYLLGVTGAVEPEQAVGVVGLGKFRALLLIVKLRSRILCRQASCPHRFATGNG